MPTKNTLRLSDFILEHMEPILQAWEDFARTIEPPALIMDNKALRNHAEHMLKAIAADLLAPQTLHEQSEKSKGRATKPDDDTAAEIHAAARLLSGYTVVQLVSEYRALRSSVLKLWAENINTGLGTDADDITRFNEAIDQALAESVARYAQMVKQSQNLFLAILGHDLRNPLATVVTGANLIMRAPDLNSKYVLAATRICTSGERMVRLVEDLIDFTRTHLGPGIPVKPTHTNAAAICLNVVDELRTQYPDRTIKFDAVGKLEGFWDEPRISQVFANLVANALQHGLKEAPVTVKLYSDSDTIIATVQNKSEPIPPERLQTLFDPLVRFAEQETITPTKDTSLGIGLFIAKEIVQAHSGTIRVESSKSAGTTFTIHLPRIPTLENL
jgi:signal transduction histidine kinase